MMAQNQPNLPVIDSIDATLIAVIGGADVKKAALRHCL